MPYIDTCVQFQLDVCKRERKGEGGKQTESERELSLGTQEDMCLVHTSPDRSWKVKNESPFLTFKEESAKARAALK